MNGSGVLAVMGLATEALVLEQDSFSDAIEDEEHLELIQSMREARATVAATNYAAQVVCNSFSPSLVRQSKKNPNAGFIDWRDWIALYGEVNALRQALARAGGES